MSARRSAYLKLFIVILIWGIAPPIIKYTLDYFPTNIFLTYRFFVSTLIMLPLLFILEKNWQHKLSNLTPTAWLALLINSLLGSVIQLGLLFWGLEYTSSLEGSIINSLSPILVAISGYLFLHEKITYHEKLGLLLAFAGSIVIVFAPSQNHSSGSAFGNLLIFIGTLSWAIYTIISKKHLNLHLSPLFLTTAMFFIGFVAMSFITLNSNLKFQISNYFVSAPVSAHLGVLYMAILSGSLAYFLYQSATKYIEVSEANIFMYLTPLVTMPVSIFWLNESLNLVFILGCLIVIAGVTLAEIKRR